jgi:hypothetical protein
MSFPRFVSTAGDAAFNVGSTRRYLRPATAAALGLILLLALFQSAPRYDRSPNIRLNSNDTSQIAQPEENVAPLITGRSIAVSPLHANDALLGSERKREGVGALGFARR